MSAGITDTARLVANGAITPAVGDEVILHRNQRVRQPDGAAVAVLNGAGRVTSIRRRGITVELDGAHAHLAGPKDGVELLHGSAGSIAGPDLGSSAVEDSIDDARGERALAREADRALTRVVVGQQVIEFRDDLVAPDVQREVSRPDRRRS